MSKYIAIEDDSDEVRADLYSDKFSYDQGLDCAKQKGTFDFPQNSIKTPSGDFKQVSEEFQGRS